MNNEKPLESLVVNVCEGGMYPSMSTVLCEILISHFAGNENYDFLLISGRKRMQQR
jgi:hypothetical protein